MKPVHNPLRWFALPFVFIAAVGTGIWLWLLFGALAVSHCPPELVWHGGASGNAKCSWPLGVFFVKDMGGATIMAALAVVLCAAAAPARKAATASTAAVGICALALLYLRGGDHALRAGGLVFAVGASFATSAWLAAWLVCRGWPFTRQRPPAASQTPAATSH